MSQTIDILGLGCAAVDDIIHVDQYPVQDAKAAVLTRERRCGGLTAGALIAAAKLGARCSYAGCLGENEPSDFVRRNLTEHGVSIDQVKHVSAALPITSTIVVDRASGSRNIFFDLNGLVEVAPGWPTPEVIQSARVLLVDHFNVRAQIRAAEVARESKIPIVADFESDSDPEFPTLQKLADHLIVSRAFAERLTGFHEPDDAALALWHPDRKTAVVTCGASGTWFATRSTNRSAQGRVTIVGHQPAFRVQATDTTGCGDVFHGAYAAALGRGASVSTAVQFASAAAAIKAMRAGGVANAPNRNEVIAFMESKTCATSA